VDEHPLLEAEGQKEPRDWSPDGRYILYLDREPKGLCRIGLTALPLFGERKPLTILEKTPRESPELRFSPDGRWLAFATNDTGRDEVFVTSFPTPSDKWQISTDGGVNPRWRGDGKELFYISLDGKLISVDIQGGKSFQAGAPKQLFETSLPSVIDFTYDVAADGQRFLMTLPPDTATRPLNLVVNRTSGLRR
jgi:Tol biopolymer transport system component